MRLLAPLVVLVVLLAAVWHWDQAEEGADLVIVNRGDVFTLDPQRMTYLRDFRMAAALYEGLVRWDNHDFSIVPAAAESLPEVSEDGRTYMFRIAEDARWSNGDPVTAHDFVYSFRRALLPDTASYYTSLLFTIEGAREFFDWRSEALSAVGSGLSADEMQQHRHSRAGGNPRGIRASPALSLDSRLRGNDNTVSSREPRAESRQPLWAETLRSFDAMVGIKAIDERTLVITLERPVAYFLDILCMPIAYPVHEPTVSAHERLDPRTGRLEQRQQWSKAGELVSNGPYQLARWRFKRDMLLVRNEHYHRPEIVMNDSVLAVTIEDANTAVLAFKAGGIDWMDEVNVEYAPDMLDDGYRPSAVGSQPKAESREPKALVVTPAFATEFYNFNCRPTLAGGRANPFADARVRRAFTMAVDRERIVRHVTRLHEPVARTLIPPGSIPGYGSPQGIGFDLEQARRELREAGWFDRTGEGVLTNERGEAFPVVDLLWTTTAPRHRWIALELKAQLERNLGVQVELRGLDARFYREDLRRGNFMLARGSWYGDYGDPTTFLDLSRTDDGNNHRRYSHPYVDDLLARAEHETDPAARMGLLEECERFLFDEEVPMLVLFHPVRVSMYDPEQLHGVSRHPRAIQYLWQMHRVRR